MEWGCHTRGGGGGSLQSLASQPGLPSRMLRLEMGPSSSATAAPSAQKEMQPACAMACLTLLALASQGHDLWNSENTQDPILLSVSRSDSRRALPSALCPHAAWAKAAPKGSHSQHIGPPSAQPSPGLRWGGVGVGRTQTLGGKGSQEAPPALRACIAGSGRDWRQGRTHRHLWRPGTSTEGKQIKC